MHCGKYTHVHSQKKQQQIVEEWIDIVSLEEEESVVREERYEREFGESRAVEILNS